MKNTYSTVYVINTVFQAIFSFIFDIGLSFVIGYALVRWLDAPDWIYIPLIILGVIIGMVSMIRFILSAMNALDRLEKERAEKYRAKRRAEEKRSSDTESETKVILVYDDGKTNE